MAEGHAGRNCKISAERSLPMLTLDPTVVNRIFPNVSVYVRPGKKLPFWGKAFPFQERPGPALGWTLGAERLRNEVNIRHDR